MKGPLSGIAGRRVCLMAVCLPLFLGWMLITTATNTAMIITGRLLTGIISGIFCCATPTYVIEVAPLSLRGALGSGFQVFVTIGILISSVLGTATEWKLLAFLSSIPVIVMPIILYFCPESPVYLFNKKGAGKETMNALRLLRSENSSVDAELEQIAKTPKEKQPMILSWEQLKMPIVYYPFFYACGILFFQQASGINAVIFNELDIFILSGIKMNPNYCSIILNGVAVIATIASASVSDRFGRKVLLFVSGVGNTLALFSLSVCFYLTKKDPNFGQNYGWIALLSTIAYLAFFALGYGPIPWAIAPEMSPYFARGFITAIGTFLNWGTAFLVTKEFEKMEHLLTPAGSFAFFTIISFIGLLFTSFVLPETKGKSIDEILAIFEKKTKPVDNVKLATIEPFP
ncbi:facilitated trehalose transporter Tret1-like isoform X2 [Panonychus citri]|uniref:facilitated trehalose transporter Tret1-like isoform X2 n=1 Tax=Panonychus citri TaxID=50023 RepID=UPI002307934D|nr:facilitated trehalose transporter Tret1-like isoform X2 [Panonychus citri]